MGILNILKIGASALNAQRLRMETIATNLANVNSTRTDEGGPYKKKEVTFTPTDLSENKMFGRMLNEKIEGVKVEEVKMSDRPFQKVHDPGHPDADQEGYVTYPNVNLMEEMADMMVATRAYEANVNVVNTTKDMFLKALDIGR
ncbi:MAG TPA: flagellar basal body rod protein FlgC [Syntrophorhabdaceae bacterium]|jgi:flagellar basal-body rod protein FlgC